MNTNFEMDLVDSCGRTMDDIYIYYGSDKINDIDEFAIINRIYKSRDMNKAPKGGFYCMPEELFSKLGYKYSTSINKNFRNVQYIKINDTIYWIYCFSIINLYKFEFMGTNMSIALCRILLRDHGFELGFKRKKKISNNVCVDMDNIVEVWFNKDSMKLLVLKIKGFEIYERMVYYRRFEGYRILNTEFLSNLFNSDIMCIPLIPRYPDDLHKYLFWTGVVDISVPEDYNDDASYKANHIPFYQSDYDINSLYFDKENYDTMLKYMFNKRGE